MSEGKLTFTKCLAVCAGTPSLVSEFDRLTGGNLSRKGAATELMIDDATKRTDSDLARFVESVYECVWCRLPPESREAPTPLPAALAHVPEWMLALLAEADIAAGRVTTTEDVRKEMENAP